MPMNPEIKARWVAALRDGRPQTRGVLERVKEKAPSIGAPIPAGQCCLGVLCSIAADEGIVSRTPYDGPDEGVVGFRARNFTYDDDGKPVHTDGDTSTYVETGTLPIEVYRWAGMDNDNPYVQPDPVDPTTRNTLAVLNDQGKTFEQIADLIDTQL